MQSDPRDLNPYDLAIQVWQTMMVDFAEAATNATRFWIGVPGAADAGGRSAAAESSNWGGFISSAVEAQKRIEARAVDACAVGMQLGHRTLREVEAVTIDCGTVDPKLQRRAA